MRLVRFMTSHPYGVPARAGFVSAIALAFVVPAGCRDRTFNAITKATDDDAGTPANARTKRDSPHYLACLSDKDWTIDFLPESQTLTVAAQGKILFKGEVKSHVDRSLPVSHVHEAYALRDAAHYARQEIVTDLGNLTIDRVVDDGEPLQRTLLLAFRIEGDGIQRTIECNVASRTTWNGPQPEGIDKSRFATLGPDAFGKAPRWSALTRPARTVIEDFREIAACEIPAPSPPQRWVAFRKDDVLVVGRASAEVNAPTLARYLAETPVRARVAKVIEVDGERDVEGARYYVTSRTWKLATGDDVRFESFTERGQGRESLYHGSVWTVAGKALRCSGQLGLLPPGGP